MPKITSFLLIAHYLLFMRFLGNRTIFVLNPNNIMNSLIDLPLVARSYLNPGLS